MIRQTIDIDGYWKVIVYYNVDYNFFNIIASELRNYGSNESNIKEVYTKMSSNRAKAVTISFYNHKTCIVLFNKHKNYYDYINSIIHEAEHIKQSMLDVYNVDDSGEAPAYTIGYLAMQMIKMFNLHKN